MNIKNLHTIVDIPKQPELVWPIPLHDDKHFIIKIDQACVETEIA